jgi:membrane associated rhomboid family serine protease
MPPVVGHEIRAQRWPYVTISLVALNVAVFVFELTFGSHFVAFVQQWGFIPARFGAGVTGHEVATLATATFLHIGSMQLALDVVFLAVFGDPLEEALGHWWFLLVYVAGGLVALFMLAAADSGSVVPAVGAGGAVAAVLGAGVVVWPRARIGAPAIVISLGVLLVVYVAMITIGVPGMILGGPALFVIGILATIAMTRKGGNALVALLRTVEVPAYMVLILFLTMSVLAGLFVLAPTAYAHGVTWWAQIAGCGAGALLGAIVPKHPRPLRARALLD